MTEDRSCLSYWFPRLQESGIPVPKTWTIKTAVDINGFVCRMDDGDASPPDGFQELIQELKDAAAQAGTPCFLRTGQTSGKHEWRKTCFVSYPDTINRNVMALAEFSILADFMGLSLDVWVVREFIRLQVAFRAFDGMPVAREFRAFMRNGQLICVHPYWPPKSIRNPDMDDWEPRLARMSRITPEVDRQIRSAISEIAPQFDGSWSVDLCPDIDGRWLVTDMAEMDRSFHWPDCPNCPEHMKEAEDS